MIPSVSGLPMSPEVQQQTMHIENIARRIEVASAAKRKAAFDKLTLLIKQYSTESDRNSIKGTADAAVRAMVIIRRAYAREQELTAQIRAQQVLLMFMLRHIDSGFIVPD
ncbi:hypothetical protein SISSUDRAFT_1051829 [Sistotremastrum suecicum HHB10207 ss-3]|uniref:Uncharacterized protein n=1 Tax=Sistotremastrum suecicum HHB10207 ss-3 TaxID=1314776 RepID=A0A166AA61_9AGAM|nr:hypothetical protein SISSUDRAFT_1051829 [Sistotremastrum suecicum HHB10207 ss-3]